MALTAKFVSDFSAFYDSVAKASAQLGTFEKDANKVTTSLNRMVESLSGRTLIQNASIMARAVEEVGGVSALTEKELGKVSRQAAEAVEKMKALGIDVPPELQKLADAEKDVGRESDSLTVSFGKLFASTFTAQAAWDLLKAGFSMTIDLMRESVTAAAEADAATGRLLSALRAQGTAMPSVVAAYDGYIDALAKTTIYQDDALTSSAAFLAQVGGVMPRDMQAALTAATNLAAALGIDLTQATEMVARAAEGNTTALKKHGVALDDGKVKAEGFSYVLDTVNEKFSGAAADAANTYSGRLTQLANTWNNVQEAIGRAVTQNGTVLELINRVTGAIADNSGKLNDNRQFMNLVSDGVILLTRGFGLMVLAIAKTGEAVASSMKDLAFFADGIEGILDLLARFVRVIAKLGDTDAKKLLPVLEGLQQKTAGWRDTLQDSARRTQEFSRYAADMAGKVDAVADALATTRGAQVQLTASTRENAAVWQQSTPNIVANTAAQKAATEAAENAAKAQKKFQDSAHAYRATVLSAIPPLQSFRTEIEGVYQLNDDFSYALMQSQIKTDAFGHALKVNLEPSLKGIKPALVEASAGVQSFGQTVQQYFAKDFGKTIVSALAGGGNVVKAAVASFGNALFSPAGSFATSITKGVTDIFGEKGIMGTIGKSLSSLVPMIGSFLGPAIEGVSKLFGKLFGKSEETAKVSPLRDEFFKLQGGLETLNPRVEQLAGNLGLVQAVFDAKTVEQYNAAIGNLNALFQQEDDAIKAVTEAAQRYGLTLEELGPALQRQELDKQAQQLYKDFKILTAAGIDSVTVTGRMADSVHAYVNAARAMGIEVPAAMRPMLEQMAQMGQLTDASGNKIEHLEDSGISFALTMSEGFNALIKEVQKLAEVLTRSLGTAVDQTTSKIRGIPSKVPIEIVYSEKNAPTAAGKEVPGYQEGTRGRFVDFGAGSLVMLHGREAVVPEDQPLVTAGSLSAAGGAPAAPMIVINAQGAFFDTPDSLQRLADKVNEALTQKYGMKNRLRAA